MADNREHPDYEYFPYKSYEELNAEKRRKAVRKGLGTMAGLFLLLVAIVVGVGLTMGGSPLHLWENTGSVKKTGAVAPADKKNEPASQEQTDSAHKGDLNISASAEPEDGAGAINVKDVSDVVAKAKRAVVGVTTELYRTFTTQSRGSGIILSKDGYIVTNNHVISGGDSITVTLEDGTSYPAYVIGSDEYTDIAVIKITASGLTAAEIGDSDSLEVGEAAIAIGNPTGQLLGTATAGIISGVNRNVLVNNMMMNLIQTDAAINQGNSGGPLLNQYGQVIGVTSIKVSMAGYEGLGFAIPINSVVPIVKTLVENGYVTGRPLVGVAGSDVSFMAAQFYGLPQGIYVSGVDPNSDAYQKGLKEGDIITGLGKTKITKISEGCCARNAYEAGDTVTLNIYRSGGYREITVKLGEQTGDGGSYNF